MKNRKGIILGLAMSVAMSAAMGASAEEDKLSVVTTIFPEYDWVKEIVGEADDVEITMLLDKGTDLHSYEPTADDMVKIANADVFIYVGGESDEWVDDALANAVNPDMKVINLLESLGDAVKEEEVVEGMQEEDEHEHDHGEEITEEDIEDRTLAEFAGTWMSLYPMLQNGDLDEFCEHKAAEDEDDSTSKDTYFEKYTASWTCDAEKISIEDNTITFTDSDGNTRSAEYEYAGYSVIKDEDGDIKSVRYQFTTSEEGAPAYVQFNDHGHEPGVVEHFHVYFGNDGFDELMDCETNPYFVKEGISTEEAMEGLMGHDHGHEEEAEYDEHVWLSLKNAEVLCKVISEELAQADPENADTYLSNAESYIEKLSALDEEYADAVANANKKTVLFGDRFPFRYLVDDYGLDYYAAFVGCSAETEASFETVAFLADKLNELELGTVLTIEGTDHRIADTIISTAEADDTQVLSMDSLQSTTGKDVEDGASYLDTMQKNLEVLKSALE